MFTIRRAVESDSPHVYEVHVRSIREVCAPSYTPEEIHDWTVRKRPEGYVPVIKTRDFFVATADERVVGFSEFNPETSEVAAVYVHPEFTGQGVGRALLEHAEAAALARGATRLHLSSSLNAVPFYEKHGYVVDKHGSVTLGSGRALRCVFMHRELAGQ
jgi:putative acetyltransferase